MRRECAQKRRFDLRKKKSVGKHNGIVSAKLWTIEGHQTICGLNSSEHLIEGRIDNDQISTTVNNNDVFLLLVKEYNKIQETAFLHSIPGQNRHFFIESE